MESAALLQEKTAEEPGRDGTNTSQPNRPCIVTLPVFVTHTVSREDDIQVAVPNPSHQKRSSWNEPMMVLPLPELPNMQVASGPWFSRFILLPREIQIMILSYLDFGEMEQLRRTCKFIRSYMSKPMLGAIYPKLETAILGTCRLCLTSPQYGKDIILTTKDHPQYPFSSNCVKCLVTRGKLKVDRKYTLGNGLPSFVCRMCGYPVALTEEGENDGHFHVMCERVYLNKALTFVLMGVLQAMIHIVATSLCWAFYKTQPLVLGCTTAIFFLSIWAFLLFLHRKMFTTTIHTRTWHWSLLVEVAMLVLWIVIVYKIVSFSNETEGKMRASDVATLVFVASNILMRFVNSIGFFLFMCEIKYWRLNKPDLSRYQKWRWRFITFMFMSTYPDAICQHYPAQWFRSPPLFRRRHRLRAALGFTDREDNSEEQAGTTNMPHDNA